MFLSKSRWHLTLEECDAVVAAADRTGHAADRRPHPRIRSEHPRNAPDHPKRRTGPARDDPQPSTTTTFFFARIAPTNSTPRRDGGIAFNQLAHQIEIVRLLGGRVRCGARERRRARRRARLPGHCTAFLDFENGAAASITFSAYDFFDSDEWHHWIAEGGASKQRTVTAAHASAFLARANELTAHQDLGYGGRVLPTSSRILPHFGLDRCDLRAWATCGFRRTGVLIHGLERHARDRGAARHRPARAGRRARRALAGRQGRAAQHPRRAMGARHGRSDPGDACNRPRTRREVLCADRPSAR